MLVLAGCSSGGGSSGGSTSKATTPQQADAALTRASTSVQSAMATYLTAVGACTKEANPVVCLEAADHTLGDKIHAFANVLAGHHHFSAPQADLSTTLNAAQTLANSLEILGDAQPTQANYNQVLNTFNVNSAITQLQGDVSTLRRSLDT
jgi:hypothetical protein